MSPGPRCARPANMSPGPTSAHKAELRPRHHRGVAGRHRVDPRHPISVGGPEAPATPVARRQAGHRPARCCVGARGPRARALHRRQAAPGRADGGYCGPHGSALSAATTRSSARATPSGSDRRCGWLGQRDGERPARCDDLNCAGYDSGSRYFLRPGSHRLADSPSGTLARVVRNRPSDGRW